MINIDALPNRISSPELVPQGSKQETLTDAAQIGGLHVYPCSSKTKQPALLVFATEPLSRVNAILLRFSQTLNVANDVIDASKMRNPHPQEAARSVVLRLAHHAVMYSQDGRKWDSRSVKSLCEMVRSGTRIVGCRASPEPSNAAAAPVLTYVA